MTDWSDGLWTEASADHAGMAREAALALADAELEAVLGRHPSVGEVAVVGVALKVVAALVGLVGLVATVVGATVVWAMGSGTEATDIPTLDTVVAWVATTTSPPTATLLPWSTRVRPTTTVPRASSPWVRT